MSTLLRTLYGYHAWANAELIGKLALVDPVARAEALKTALRLVNHYHVVARIFAAHLTGGAHPYASDNTVETPALADLGASLAAIDRWYLDYIGEALPETLGEPVSFAFTDGDRGCMTREEMLLHVAVHATIHRGEACRILAQLGITPPWDTLAVYLHQTEPGRRELGRGRGASRASPTKLGEVARRSRDGGGVAQRARQRRKGGASSRE
ncbi:hypothetical protein GCM10007874_09470 [Labrys miyagiensis]|uniref:Damage-inducible protein DinB n=1 Tax=Labrys miyagiensis TaxID=346912 RepID=A0ABQ6CI49_9HYPH|nr:hypothetical protein GCM10007874_09470 [Labrys miyagiensis]